MFVNRWPNPEIDSTFRIPDRDRAKGGRRALAAHS